MINKPIYRIGLSETEVDKVKLDKLGFSYRIVEPRKQMVISAKSVVGKPYKRGASVLNDAPNFFDCSSLVAWAAVESGFAIPRVSVDQYVFSKRITKDDLRPGDLIFSNTKEIIHTEGSYFSKVLDREVKEEAIRTETLEFMPGTKVPEGIDHVGIYIGENMVIHSGGKNGGVCEELLDGCNSFKNVIGYGRIINDEDKRFVVEVPGDKPELRSKENIIKILSNSVV
ncbi:MAG: NLP/P60 family protein [Parcubacteria bacterium C7867-005]|nr:MAG: NLP/P60 family protein [Parcubacteria bacterium C7867-005]